ncbi:hypothetical protein E2C01_028472 [Portunus trituberculatus]|uniref:Uncharacterized protein n=1 Tax=Portunus trituberculatus TaxID=210409 RepID=A0A5B7EKQ5_PORTR|nr:hypothetical protein [Portunus trituberculatus]
MRVPGGVHGEEKEDKVLCSAFQSPFVGPCGCVRGAEGSCRGVVPGGACPFPSLPDSFRGTVWRVQAAEEKELRGYAVGPTRKKECVRAYVSPVTGVGRHSAAGTLLLEGIAEGKARFVTAHVGSAAVGEGVRE